MRSGLSLGTNVFTDPSEIELFREAMKALGHALHLTEHNKANCARCREAHKRIRATITKLEERLLSE